MAEEITASKDENGEKPGTKPSLEQETLEKERIETGDGFVWTVTIKIRDAVGRTSIGVGACNSNETGKKMAENEVLGLARKRAKENAVEEAEIYYAPRKPDFEGRLTLGKQMEVNGEIYDQALLGELAGKASDVEQQTLGFDCVTDEKTLRDICNNDGWKTGQYALPEHGKTLYTGLGSDGLIWIFHNRLLPVKFILTIIADLITKSESQFIDYDEVRERIRSRLEYFTGRIIEMDEEEGNDRAFRYGKRKTGFPKTRKTALRSSKMKKFVDKNTGGLRGGNGTRIRMRGEEELDRAVRESQDRFIDQFFGRYDKSAFNKSQKRMDGYDGKPITFTGACFEMGLLSARQDLGVTLTPMGIEFVCIRNPVFTKIEDGDYSMIDIISHDEAMFFLSKIITQTRFSLERKVMAAIFKRLTEIAKELEKQRKEAIKKHEKPEGRLTADEKEELPSTTALLSVQEIVEIFIREQKDHLKETLPKEESSTKIEENIKKYGQQRAITTASRLVEICILEKVSVDNKDEKKPPTTSYTIGGKAEDREKLILEMLLKK